MLEIILYSVIAFFIAWIWVDYYRLIDIYDKESLKYFAFTFFLGCASVLIIYGAELYLFGELPFHMNGDFINDFLYCVFRIGLLEEIAKIIPFFIMYLLFKKQINEPVDYIVFISISALGFSAAENVLYFYEYGPRIINGRAILATVGHMFDTALVAYGLIRIKFYTGKYKVFVFVGFLLLASLSHGFYDFWLLYEGARVWGQFVTMLYFLITISVFATILNNALNHSSFFTYKKVINSDKVANRLLMYYGIVFLIQFILLVYYKDFMYAFLNLRNSIFLTGTIIIITVIRLSRFKLIQGRWHKIKLEFPFALYRQSSFTSRRSFVKFKIKGDSFNESHINIFYEEYFLLNPLNQKNSYIKTHRIAYIEKKIFLKDDETFYLAKVYLDEKLESFETMLIKPKTSETTMVNKIHPIVALLKIENIADIENTSFSSQNFAFKEWAFVKAK